MVGSLTTCTGIGIIGSITSGINTTGGISSTDGRTDAVVPRNINFVILEYNKKKKKMQLKRKKLFKGDVLCL